MVNKKKKKKHQSNKTAHHCTMAFHEDRIALHEDQIALHTIAQWHFMRIELYCAGLAFHSRDQITLHTIAQWHFTRTKLYCAGLAFHSRGPNCTAHHCTMVFHSRGPNYTAQHCTIGLAFHSRGSNYTSEGPFLQVGSKITPQTMRNDEQFFEERCWYRIAYVITMKYTDIRTKHTVFQLPHFSSCTIYARHARL